MAETDRITDQEFLDQLVERLRSSGHKLVFVDRGFIYYAKFTVAALGLFVLLGIILFGFNVEKLADELAETRSEIQIRKGELDRSLAEAEIKIEKLGQLEAEIGRRLTPLGERLTKTERQVRDSFSRSLISLIGVVAETVPEADIGELRDFYQTNLEIAEQHELHLLRIGFLRRLARFEWHDGDRVLSRRLFDQAVQAALSHDKQNIAAEILTTQGRLEQSRYFDKRQVAVAKAKRLFDRALGLLEASGDTARRAEALRLKAEAFRLEEDNKQALDSFEKARLLYLDLSTNKREELVTLTSIAEIYRKLGETSTAVRYYSESIPIAEELREYYDASEQAVELAKLEDVDGDRVGYLCTANQYFTNAQPPPKKLERFQRRLERIDSSFDPEAACTGGAN